MRRDYRYDTGRDSLLICMEDYELFAGEPRSPGRRVRSGLLLGRRSEPGCAEVTTLPRRPKPELQIIGCRLETRSWRPFLHPHSLGGCRSSLIPISSPHFLTLTLTIAQLNQNHIHPFTHPADQRAPSTSSSYDRSHDRCRDRDGHAR